MNEIDILRQYISKPRQLKKINGVMTPVFIKPYVTDGECLKLGLKVGPKQRLEDAIECLRPSLRPSLS